MEDISEDDFLVHAKPFLEEFTCPVCFETIENVVSTPCGHSFCRDCLNECLNIKKTCPTCTLPVNEKLVLNNKHLERILQLLKEQKAKAVKEQFSKLLAPSAPPKGDLGDDDPKASFIQTIFQKHLMKSLGTYEDYLKKLRSAAESSAAEAVAEYEKDCAQIKKSGGSPTELQQLKARHSEVLASIHQGCSLSESRLQHEYDEFLSTNLVNPSFLPVQVIVVIEATGSRYPFILEPTHTLRDLKKFLLTKPARPDAPDLITRISSKKNPFVIRPPFVHGDSSKPSSSRANGSSKADKEVKIDQKHVPLTQNFDIFPGSQIVMLGMPFIKLQTKECFKATFAEADTETHKCSFMVCKTCNRNWICKNCAQVCHAGHEMAVHVVEKAWKTPCCYCTKTGKCTLYQKK